jgi:hypothetical protein
VLLDPAERFLCRVDLSHLPRTKSDQKFREQVPTKFAVIYDHDISAGEINRQGGRCHG